jgi:hypothetical protein
MSATDGLFALARAMRAHLASGSRVYEVGGEGARRAARALSMCSVSIEPERGEAAVAAAIGARAGKAPVWLLASGGATELLARAMRASSRGGFGPLVGVIPSHGDDEGTLVPLADGSDLAALDSAPCARWVASSAHEIESLVEMAATTGGGSPDGAGDASPHAHSSELSTAIVFDLRSVGLRIEPARADGAVAERSHGATAKLEGAGSVALVSVGSSESAARAARWLRDSGLSCVSLGGPRLSSLGEEIAAPLSGVELAVVHEIGAPYERARWAIARWAARAMPRARLVTLGRGPAASAAFCEAVASESSLRRASLDAASRTFSIQLVGPPSTRFAAVGLALEALSLAGLAPSAECVEPTHARIDCDTGPAGAVGGGGWVLIVPGLSVQAPIEPSLRGGAMIADAGRGSALLSSKAADPLAAPADQAALAVAAVLAELELRANRQASEVLCRVVDELDRRNGRGSPWAEVRARSAHLRSLR